jgi:hypothetical protein
MFGARLPDVRTFCGAVDGYLETGEGDQGLICSVTLRCPRVVLPRFRVAVPL